MWLALLFSHSLGNYSFNHAIVAFVFKVPVVQEVESPAQSQIFCCFQQFFFFQDNPVFSFLCLLRIFDRLLSLCCHHRVSQRAYGVQSLFSITRSILHVDQNPGSLEMRKKKLLGSETIIKEHTKRTYINITVSKGVNRKKL